VITLVRHFGSLLLNQKRRSDSMKDLAPWIVLSCILILMPIVVAFGQQTAKGQFEFGSKCSKCRHLRLPGMSQGEEGRSDRCHGRVNKHLVNWISHLQTIQPAYCHRSVQNRPVIIDSKLRAVGDCNPMGVLPIWYHRDLITVSQHQPKRNRQPGG
jgi:hypothetical protein